MNGLSESEYEDCQALFSMLDINQNNLIDFEELISGFHELGLQYSDSEINALLKECDKDRNGQLSLEEFIDVYKKAIAATSVSEEEVKSMFKKFDYNRSGTLSRSELKQVLMNNELVFTNDEIDVLLRDFDENLDNELDYEEFLHSVLGFSH